MVCAEVGLAHNSELYLVNSFIVNVDMQQQDVITGKTPILNRQARLTRHRTDTGTRRNCSKAVHATGNSVCTKASA